MLGRALVLEWWFSETAEAPEEEFSSSEEADPSSSGCPSWKVGFLCPFVVVPFAFVAAAPLSADTVLTLFLRGRWLLFSGVELTA